jgi:hypothetical protein
MLDNYLVVVLPLAIPLFMHILDIDRVAYLSTTQIPASKDVFDDLGCFRPALRTEKFIVLFTAD